MALLDNTDQSQSPGLLGNLGPLAGLLMMGIGGGMRRRNGGAGGGSGGGFNPLALMQAQEQAQRQALSDQLELARYQLSLGQDKREQIKFQQEQEKAQREAEEASKQQDLRSKSAQAVLDYKPPVGQMPYVEPEYENITETARQNAPQLSSPQSMAEQAIKNQVEGISPNLPAINVPTDRYLNNIDQAGEEAKRNAPPGPIVSNELIRQQAAALMQSTEPADHKLAWQLLNGAAPYTLSPGQTRYDVTNQPVATAPNSGSKTLNAPPGYQWIDPSDQSKGLKVIPGGPAAKTDANEAGRQQMVQAANNNLDNIIENLMPNGKVDRSLVKTMFFGVPYTQGRLLRSQMEDAIAAKLRLETGAQANPSEIVNMRDRYLPSPFDSDENVADKLRRFKLFMSGASGSINTSYGKSDNSSSSTSQTKQTNIRRYNRQTGRFE